MRNLIFRLLGRPREQPTQADLEQLTRLVRRYAIEQQQVPRSLGDLVSLKYLEAAPAAPHGREFVIDRKRVEVRLE